MKCLVSLIALIALLGCGSDSNLITPEPAMDMEQPAERDDMPAVEDPLVEDPEVIIAEILNQDPPIIRVLDPDAIAQILNQDPPEVPALEPPEVPDIIIAEVLENPPKIRVLKPPEVQEIVIHIQKNDDPPVVIRINPPERMPEPPNGDPPPDE